MGAGRTGTVRVVGFGLGLGVGVAGLAPAEPKGEVAQQADQLLHALQANPLQTE